MVRVLPPWLIGALSFAAFILNTLFWVPPLLVTALVRTLVPWPPLVRACRRVATFIAETGSASTSSA